MSEKEVVSQDQKTGYNPLKSPELRKLLFNQKGLSSQLRLLNGDLKPHRQDVRNWLETLGVDTARTDEVMAVLTKESYYLKAHKSYSKEELEDLFRTNPALQNFFVIRKKDRVLQFRLNLK